MNDGTFWQLIEDSLGEAGHSCEAQADWLREALVRLGRESGQGKALPMAFYDHMRGYMAALHTFEVLAADFLVEHTVTTDVFRAFRAWLVCRGREKYRAVLSDVSAIAGFLESEQVDTLDGNSLLHAPEEAFEVLGGFEDDFYSQVHEPIEPPLTHNWPDSWESVSGRWPVLYEKFGRERA